MSGAFQKQVTGKVCLIDVQFTDLLYRIDGWQNDQIRIQMKEVVLNTLSLTGSAPFKELFCFIKFLEIIIRIVEATINSSIFQLFCHFI